MRFLIDAQLPPALVGFFQAAGHTAEHVYGFNLHTADDEAIWRETERSGAVLVTKDEDFSNLIRIRQSSASVIWIRFGNSSNRMLIDRLKTVLPEIVGRLKQGEKLIEVL